MTPVKRRLFGGVEETIGSLGGADPWASSQDEGRRLGLLVHALMEDFHWASDEPRTEEGLRAICTRISPDQGLVEEALARFHSATKSPALAALFQEPTTEYRLVTERLFDVEITDLDRDPLRWRGTIDRLLLLMEDGVVTRAKIVDYKTEAASGSPEVLYRHRDQLVSYRQAVSALFDLDEKHIDCVIAWLPGGGAEEIIPVIAS